MLKKLIGWDLEIFFDRRARERSMVSYPYCRVGVTCAWKLVLGDGPGEATAMAAGL
jgi:hypothetical protein